MSRVAIGNNKRFRRHKLGMLGTRRDAQSRRDLPQNQFALRGIVEIRFRHQHFVREITDEDLQIFASSLQIH